MKKSYRISRIILPIITFIIINILFINEDVSWIIISIILAPIAFLLSFPSSIISKKIINIGNNIEGKLIKALYYIVTLPLISFLSFLILIQIIGKIMDFIGITTNLNIFDGILLFGIVLICIILPYIQTLLVLILNRFIKD